MKNLSKAPKSSVVSKLFSFQPETKMIRTTGLFNHLSKRGAACSNLQKQNEEVGESEPKTRIILVHQEPGHA